ncbi:MAG TPA: rRNA pseudouridine synthase [Firmicutes bacterium]|nr:rRNA pseudouridine synthase [Bacillota bacterium]
MKERLQKVMARAGVASRRACEQLILAGRVTVNGKVVRELGTKVDLSHDSVAVDGKLVGVPERYVYYILHKPRGFLTTVSDDRGRKTVMQLLKSVPERIFPVGRLDYDSEGLLILTNDGQLANRLMHPRYQVRKFYLVKVANEVTASDVEKLRTGVELEDGITSPAYVQLLAAGPKESLLKIGIREGRNRQIRRMCQALDFKVKRLIRTQIGPVKLGNLAAGAYRRLTEQEIGKLKQAVNRSGR